MITEDYCSYEVAKLLKEKGFNESCYTYYDDIDDSINRFDKGLHFSNTSYPWGVPYDISKAKKYVVAPTLQMAMQWLREVHNLFIVIDKHYFVVDKISHIASGFKYSIEIKRINTIYTYNGYKSYEEAVEAALKYCLENLI